MVTGEKSLDQAANRWEVRIMAKTVDILDASSDRALKMLSYGFARLRETDSAREPIPVHIIKRSAPTTSGNMKAAYYTRLSVNAKVIDEIKGCVKEYKQEIREAIHNASRSAGEQPFSIEEFNGMMGELQKNVVFHTRELSNLFKLDSAKFESAKTYEGLVAEAATLREVMCDTTRRLPEELRGMVNKKLLDAWMRKGRDREI